MQSNNNQRVNKFYVYGHYTNNNILFYIGVGTIRNFKSEKNTVKYSRAYHFFNRNKYWNNIKNKYGVQVKIIQTFKTRQECLDKEKELITQFGRRVLKTGILCNMSSGGEIGPIGVSHIKSESLRKQISDRKSIYLFVYDKNGNFIKKIRNIENVAKFCGVTYNAVHSCMKTKNFTNGFFVFRSDQGNKLSYTYKDLNFKSTLSRKVITIDEDGNKTIHNSIADCCVYLKTDRKNLKRAIKFKRFCKKHKVMFEGAISSQDSK